MKTHKRYIGNALCCYCAITSLLFSILPIIFIPFILGFEISAPSILISMLFFFCSLSFMYFSFSNAYLLFAWCEFGKQSVELKTPFKKNSIMEYQKCADVGIGVYIHGVLNSRVGSREIFIYLSYNRINEKYKSNINLLKSTTTCIKIGYRKKTYEYLLNVMPPKQAGMLERSYNEYQRQLSNSRKKKK